MQKISPLTTWHQAISVFFSKDFLIIAYASFNTFVRIIKLLTLNFAWLFLGALIGLTSIILHFAKEILPFFSRGNVENLQEIIRIVQHLDKKLLLQIIGISFLFYFVTLTISYVAILAARTSLAKKDYYYFFSFLPYVAGYIVFLGCFGFGFLTLIMTLFYLDRNARFIVNLSASFWNGIKMVWYFLPLWLSLVALSVLVSSMLKLFLKYAIAYLCIHFLM